MKKNTIFFALAALILIVFTSQGVQADSVNNSFSNTNSGLYQAGSGDMVSASNVVFTNSSDDFESECRRRRKVPEPNTLLLLGAGLVGLAGFARKKVKKG